MLESTAQDIRFGWRSMLRARAFTITALLALALGIGGTSAIFSVVDAVLLAPLPLGEPDRIVAILHRTNAPVAPANFLDWKRQSTAFERMGAAEYWTPNVTGGSAPEKIQALRLTADAMVIAGIRPALGRLFLDGEDEPGREYEAVLAWGFWQRRFGGDRTILGHSIHLDGHPYTIVGVMPPRFDYPLFWVHGVELWAPLALGTRAASREGQSLRVLARLAPGVGLTRARAEIARITGALEGVYPGTNRDVHVHPLKELVVGDVRPALLVLLGAVGFVLLLACANVAHMLLARAAAREHEMTIRGALGAGRPRLVRQLLTESLLLGGAGGALGMALAALGVRALVALGGGGLPRAAEIGLDARVVAFTIVTSVATGLLFGLVPATRGSRADFAASLRAGARGAGGGARHRWLRDALVASELALALILLTGAGLAIRTFMALRNVDPGFESRGVVTMTVSFTGAAEAQPGRRVAFMEALLGRIRSLPGVEGASAINHVPVVGDVWGMPLYIEGRSLPKPGDTPVATYRVVLPGYFDAMGIPVRRGRDIAETDRLGAPRVVVVNEFLARRYWPGQDPIGKRITLDRPDSNPSWMTVIGVVKNTIRSDWAAPPAEEIYVPWLQEGQYLTGMGAHVGYMSLVVRAACAPTSPCDPTPLVPAVRNAVWSFDRNLPVAEIWTMSQVEATANARPRFTLVLLAVFAGMALALATVGVYGVMSYAVSHRTHEIGVRLALGAAPRTIVGLVVRDGLRVAIAGAAAGLVGASFLTRSMASFLYAVQPSDPTTFVAVTLVLVGAGGLATYLPARQAARTDPLRALRAD